MIHVLRLASFAFLLCGGVVACNRTAAGPEAAAQEAATLKKRDPARVRVEPVVAREMLRVLETTTRVESEHQVEIVSRSSGIVVEVLVEEGDLVTEGQILARMDDRELVIAAADAEVALEDARAAEPRLDLSTKEAEAKLSTAQRGYDQVLRDYERNVAISAPGLNRPALLSPKDLDASRLARDNALAESKNAELALERAKLDQANAKTAVRRAELTLERARLNLANTRLTAPFAGILAARNIKTGDTITTATSAFTLTDPANLRAIFYRPQRELALFTLRGQGSDAPSASPSKNAPGERAAEIEIRATAEALPGKLFRGALERIAPTIDPQSGNFRITARLNGNAEGETAVTLLPGMLVRLEIVTERHANSLVIPKRALRREGDLNMVFVVRDGHARRIAVTEGLADGESLEVTPQSGARLDAGELVVVVGNRDLEDSSEVAVSTDGELHGAKPTSMIAEATARTDGVDASAPPAAVVDTTSTPVPAEQEPSPKDAPPPPAESEPQPKSGTDGGR
ncbi:MAG TPA: efflux RND transporter periplasmic adaptor subunit [Planctomycetota bacterium]|nr:efflux RND transporter periplasmic adaptor subunit [Planctomycetota bacterium]